jgi:general secretion pathway protein A
MYESFYGMRVRPFDLTADPAFLVLTAPHREALNSLQYAIETAKPVTLLVGEAGTGKTTVLRSAIEERRDGTHWVSLPNAALTRTELIQMIGAKLGLTSRAQRSRADLLLELEALLAKRAGTQEHTVVVVDEAQNLTSEALEELRLLTNIDAGQHRPLSLVLAGHAELAKRLNEPGWQHLKQRVALRCELRPLTLQECAIYMAGRVAAAGGNPRKLFTREAVTLVYRYAHGIARTINVIADNALLGAFAAGAPTVTSPIVLDVCRDFDFAAPTPQQESQPRDTARSLSTLSATDKQVIDSIPVSPLPAHSDHVTPSGGIGVDQQDVTKERSATVHAPVFGALRVQE